MSDHVYYLVGKDSPIMKVIDECRKLNSKYALAAEEFRDKQGAAKIMTMNQERVIGLIFEGDAPDGWKFMAGETWSVPDGRTKIGKALRDKMNKLPQSPSGLDFSGMLNALDKPLKLGATSALGDFTHFEDHHFYWSNYGVYGKKVILSVPALCKVKTPGCTELKMSEFYKIVEAHKDKAAKKAA